MNNSNNSNNNETEGTPEGTTPIIKKGPITELLDKLANDPNQPPSSKYGTETHIVAQPNNETGVVDMVCVVRNAKGYLDATTLAVDHIMETKLGWQRDEKFIDKEMELQKIRGPSK